MSFKRVPLALFTTAVMLFTCLFQMPVHAAKITYTKSLRIAAGKKYQLSVKLGGKKVSAKWSSRNGKIVSTSSCGLVYARKSGKTNVYAKYKGKTFTTSVTVYSTNDTKTKLTVFTYGGSGSMYAYGTQSQAVKKYAEAVMKKKHEIRMDVLKPGVKAKTLTSEVYRYLIRNGHEYEYSTFKSNSSVTTSYKTHTVVNMTLAYHLSQSADDKSHTQASKIVKSLHLKGSAYSKALKMSSYIMSHTKYTSRNGYTAYNAFFDKCATCQGYTLAYYLMCRSAKIPCHIVYGIANGKSHMWNIFKSGKTWYSIDVTWNDNSGKNIWIRKGKSLPKHSISADSAAYLRKLK